MDTIECNKVIKNQLEKNERLYWHGKPISGIRLAGQDVVMIPISLFAIGFLIFIEIFAFNDGLPLFMLLIIGIPIDLFALYFVFGRFFVEAKQRANTFYGITNKRIIIVHGAFPQTVNSLQLDSLSELSVSLRNDGCGTIIFGSQKSMFSRFHNVPVPAKWEDEVLSFYLIPDVNKVNKIIKTNQDKIND